jgi:hypothetical protein
LKKLEANIYKPIPNEKSGYWLYFVFLEIIKTDGGSISENSFV